MANTQVDPAAGAAIRQPVLLIILDGFGFNPTTEEAVLRRVIERLPAEAATAILDRARETAISVGARHAVPLPLRDQLLALLASPVFPTTALQAGYAAFDWDQLASVYAQVRGRMAATPYDDGTLLEAVECLVGDEALKAHYSIWAAPSQFINHLRNSYPTIATQASGLAAGYEDLVPAVQGNSETGHQQIGNFIVAAQTPLEISSQIADGNFFRNPLLVECLDEVKRRGTALDVCFLLSGEYGDDGRVHSCWNHLEALLEAAFVRAKLRPDQFRLQAILDGRDCPPTSSVQRKGERYGFLFKLKDLLARYNAAESLAWVVGRSLAMDRDYEEDRSRQDFELLVHSKGLQVDDIDAAIEAVQNFHAQGSVDPNIPPIVVGKGPRRIDAGDVFLDLNFRADRQRAKIAWLLGAREFLAQEAAAKGQTWDLSWIQPPANLAVYCLSEYHPALESRYGAKVLYPISPQPHNLIALLSEQSLAQGFSFHYLLTAESTKSLHVGYFIRGRREQPIDPSLEERRIYPSLGREFGVTTDDDYYKTPQMRAFDLATFVVESLAQNSFDLIIVNLSNTDMIGHLMPKRYDAAMRSVTLIDTVLETIVPAAQRQGYATIITADHGNVEDNDSSHTVNDVLTTFVDAGHAVRLRVDSRERARLFDIPWCIVEIMGLTDRIVPHLPPIPEAIAKQGLVGHNLVQVQPAAQAARA